MSEGISTQALPLTGKPEPAVGVWSEAQPNQALVALLEAGRGRFSLLDGLDAVEEALQSEGFSEVLVLYKAPELAIHDQLVLGTLPQDSLDNCAARMTALLRLVRRHRRRIVLVDGGRFAHAPQTIFDRFGLSAVEFEAEPSAEMDPVVQLLAQEMLRQNVAVRALVEELEASALPFDDEPENEPVPLSVFSTYRQLMERARAPAVSPDEVRLLRAALNEALADAEAKQQDFRRLTEEVAELVKAKDDLRKDRDLAAARLKERDQASAQHSESDDEIAIMRVQLAQQIEDLVAAQQAAHEANERAATLLQDKEAQARTVAELQGQLEEYRQAAERRDAAAGTQEPARLTDDDLAELHLLRDQLRQQVEEYATAYTEIASLHERVRHADEEKGAALERAAQLEARVAAHDDAVSRYEKQIYQYSQGLESYEVQVKSLEAEKTRLNSDLTSALEALELAQAAGSNAQPLSGSEATLMAGQANGAAIEGQIKTLRADLEKARGELAAASADKQRVVDENRTLSQREAGLQAELERLRGGIEKSAGASSIPVASAAAMAQHVQQLSEQLAAAQAELDSIKAARFYRWLLPFRKVYASLRRKAVKP